MGTRALARIQRVSVEPLRASGTGVKKLDVCRFHGEIGPQR